MEEISIALAVSLPCEDYDTFNGLIFNALGEIPEDGSDIELTYDMLKIKVTEIKNHQVETAIVSILE